MNCIIDNVDFYNLDPQRYYSVPNSWSAEKKKENAMNKIFSSTWWGALKRDGVFGMTGKTPEGELFWRPRAKNTKGEFVNKVDWLPQIHDFLNELDPGTVLLGEVYIPAHESAKETTSVLNCLLPKSLKKQENEEYKLHFYIFDVLAENGKSYLNMKAEERFDLLNSFSRAYPHQYVEWAWYKNGQELWALLQETLADGKEGIVITNGDAVYTPGSRKSTCTLKVKKELQETIDCVIMGSNPPSKQYSGKETEVWPYWFNELTNEKVMAENYLTEHHESIYALYVDGGPVIPVTKNWFYGWAGSLKLGLYDGDNLVHVGDLSGITEEIREHWKDYVNTVVEVSCMEISQDKNGKSGFRHPRALAFFRDKNPKDCLMEQIR